jgi:hypothetical protein
MRAILASVLAISAAAVATPAFAGDDDDNRCGNVPRSQWMSLSQIEARATEKGYTIRKIEIDDGCYEVHGRDASGNQVEVYLHPVSAEVMKVERDD